MLDSVVIFDYFNSTKKSRLCSLSKFPVTLEYLVNLLPIKPRFSYKYQLFELSNSFFINANNNLNDELLIQKAVSKRSRKKILMEFQSIFAIFKNEKGFATLDPIPKILSRLSKMIHKFELENQENYIFKRFMKIYCTKNLKPKDLCIELGITRNKYIKLRQMIHRKSSNPINLIKSEKIDPLRLMIGNAPLILRLLKRISFRILSLKKQRNYLVKKYPHLKSITPKIYERIMLKLFGFKYRTFIRTYSNPDRKKLRHIRKNISFLLAKLENRDCMLLFYDSTTVNDYTFKKNLDNRKCSKYKIK